VRPRRTLLGVWAHPDDEAYLSAGLMASFRERGDRVAVVVATLGERGTSDPAAWPPERLAPHRRRELHDALAAVDVDEVHLLGFDDGGCHLVDGTDAVARCIDLVDPDLIVTFGPDGMTGHPDHRAVSRWTTSAWASRPPRAELWYATLTPSFHRRWGAVNDRIGLWAEQPEPPSTPAAELALHLRLPEHLLDRKIAALRAHASQTAALEALVGRADYRAWWAAESFRAAPGSAAAGARLPTLPARRGGQRVLDDG
jgi:LmbE family N-acetylglucosaminyl deacetylase